MRAVAQTFVLLLNPNTISASFGDWHPNQKAELSAIANALQTVRSKVLPDRFTLVKNELGRVSGDIQRLRVVVVTDSSEFAVSIFLQPHSSVTN